MPTTIAVLIMAVLSGPAFCEFQVSFGSAKEPAERMTWKADKQDVGFDYPADWGPAKPREDGGVQLFKTARGWFELSLIDLPEGESLEGFSGHIIEKSKGASWDLRLESDMGKETLAGKTAWVHKYRHKSKNTVYYGYHFIPDKGNVGIRILMVKIGRDGGEQLMEMVRSLRYPGSGAPRETPAAKTPPAVEAPIASSPEAPLAGPAATIPAGKDLPARKELGVYQDDGKIKGRVVLKNLRDKSAYPCFLAFHPIRNIRGLKRSRRLEDFEPAGEPARTATDDHGKYHLNLSEGSYRVEAYDREGRNWPITQGELLHLTGSGTLHTVWIDNRR